MLSPEFTISYCTEEDIDGMVQVCKCDHIFEHTYQESLDEMLKRNNSSYIPSSTLPSPSLFMPMSTNNPPDLDAFATNAIAALTFLSCTQEAINTWLPLRFAKQLAKREMRAIKIVHNASSTLVAFLRYQVPHVFTDEEKEERKKYDEYSKEERKEGRDPDWPVGANLEICDDKFGQLGRWNERFVERGGMYGELIFSSFSPLIVSFVSYFLLLPWFEGLGEFEAEKKIVCQLLATSPHFQRKGLASMLLRHVLDKADQEGRKTYIEATPEGHPVYEKLGWRDVALVEVDLGKYGGEGVGTNVCMIREPRCGKEKREGK